MNGLAVTIFVGQLPKLFGFSIEGDNFIAELRGFVKGVTKGDTVAAALAIGLFGLVVILLAQRWLPKLPGVLLAVILSILAASVFDQRASANRLLSSTGPPGRRACTTAPASS